LSNSSVSLVNFAIFSKQPVAIFGGTQHFVIEGFQDWSKQAGVHDRSQLVYAIRVRLLHQPRNTLPILMSLELRRGFILTLVKVHESKVIFIELASSSFVGSPFLEEQIACGVVIHLIATRSGEDKRKLAKPLDDTLIFCGIFDGGPEDSDDRRVKPPRDRAIPDRISKRGIGFSSSLDRQFQKLELRILRGINLSQKRFDCSDFRSRCELILHCLIKRNTGLRFEATKGLFFSPKAPWPVA
jgi:hypothetical protein